MKVERNLRDKYLASLILIGFGLFFIILGLCILLINSKSPYGLPFADHQYSRHLGSNYGYIAGKLLTVDWICFNVGLNENTGNQ